MLFRIENIYGNKLLGYCIFQVWRQKNRDVGRASLQQVESDVTVEFRRRVTIPSTNKSSCLLPRITRPSTDLPMDDLDLQCLNPLKWGWERKSQLLRPVQKDVDVAPEFLLKVIRCQSKVTAKDPCASNRCSCKKSGITCIIACTNCRGTECCNSNTAADGTSSSTEDVDDGNIFDLFN